MKVWLHFFEAETDQPSDDVTIALTRAGVTTELLIPDALLGCGVLCFRDVSAHLIDFVREFSHNGLTRVLAVKVSSGPLLPEQAWRLIEAGASDVLAWEELDDAGLVVAARLERWQEVDDLIESSLVENNLVGKSRAWTAILREIILVARFTQDTVLLTGETGTGKELVARLIHTLDPTRNQRDLVILDCTTIVPELSGSEFFGHERGAFTGALATREGAFELANGGTLFLDEVGELPLNLQAQLLRAVQEKTYKRVGSNTWRNTDFRLICATNRELSEEQTNGRFRRDLYYRIAAWTFRLPPLRERIEDIISLVNHFMQQARPNQKPFELDEPVREYLLAREYPGNVRDLRQLVFRIMHRHVGPGPITLGDIPEDEHLPKVWKDDWRSDGLEPTIRRAFAMGAGLRDIRRAAEEMAIRIAMADELGNLQRAAHKLGITDRALQMRRAGNRQPKEEQDAV
jgi:transcriptional regulator with GAF, ATPase, and Fis domain